MTGGSKSKPKVLVVGDAFLDRYWLGITNRVSAEAPIPVVNITGYKNLPGGAANVAENLKVLGAEVTELYGPETMVKNRLMVDDYQMARWDEHDWCHGIASCLIMDSEQPDAVVVSDYGKGAINEDNIEALASRFGDLPWFIDTKRAPTWFPQHAKFFPNVKEYSKYAAAYHDLKVVKTQGAQGISEFTPGVWAPRRMPALATHVTKVCGAGDAVLSCYAYASLTNCEDPLLFASAGAACVVERSYDYRLSTLDIETLLTRVKLSKQAA